MITLCFLFVFRPVWVMTLRLSNIIMFLLRFGNCGNYTLGFCLFLGLFCFASGVIFVKLGFGIRA